YGEVLILPEPIIDENVMTIPGIDGQKMSKSYNNYIDIFLPEKELYKSIKKIVTDTTPLEEPKNPDTCNVFALYKLLGSEFQVNEMRKNYEAGGYGYGHAKKALLEVILSRFSEERQQFAYYMENIDAIEEKLKEGESKAKIIADQTMSKVRSVLGFA
ncbi:MAG: tryptophan--tRNA ligase, partial [Cytophagales bacterium]|nr:tryptophan--tRNA ligase [Cytophagales bacterium]